MNFKNFKLLGLGALVAITGLARAQSNDSLAQRLDELDQKIRVLDRLREIDQEDAKAAAAKAPKISAGEGGLGISSADGAYSIKLRGFVQAQSVNYLGTIGPTGTPGVNSFSVKRLQNDIGGNLGKQFEYRAHINFAAGTADLLDVNLDWKIKPEFSIRFGKFKPPTGLERLWSSPRTPFIEGSFVTTLQPNRDLGIEIFGDINQGLLEYQLGLFDGARDGQNNTADNNDDKDVYGRVFANPFSKTGNEALTGLGVGISGSYGKQDQFTGALPSYATGHGNTVFSYNAADTSTGTVIRYTPQAYYYIGPFGLVAEYTATTQTVRRAAAEADLTNSAWALTGSYFVTGEKNAYKSIKVKKANTFPSFEGIGAVELLARVHGLKIDDATFPTYAAANTASEALGFGGGVKWYLNNNVVLFGAYEQTQFTDGAPAGADRQDEKVVSLSFNVAY